MRINISMSEKIAKQLDKRVNYLGLNRSEFIRSLILKEMKNNE